MDFKPIRILKRCKSEVDLSGACDRQSRRSSESSNDGFGARFSGSETDEERKDHVVDALEMKIDRLSVLFLEQCRLLTEVKDEIRDSKILLEKSEVLKKTLGECAPSLSEMDVASDSRNWRARCFLDAIETKTKRVFNLERELIEALTEFLQSDELREQIVSSVVEGLRDMIRDHFSADMSRIYLPVQQRAHRRLQRTLTRTLEDGFAELEANSASLSNSLCRVTRSLHRSLDRHQRALQTEEQNRVSQLARILEDLLQSELREWRHLMMESVLPTDDVTTWAESGPPPTQEYPESPQQPPRPGFSIIDRLMTTAEINKQIQDGDVNGAFSIALSASDLSLVMSACRAVEPAELFSHRSPRLSQSVMLSLAQQLPTDMVHDTQLKCRYLEETLLNLNPLDPVTRTHLPLVVSEIHKHLTGFLASYPGHVAHKRIMLIVMAANNLLK